MNLQTINRTMSSREIAQMSNKLHKNVMQDIRKIEEKLAGLRFQLGFYKDANNQERAEYLLTKKESLLVISGYDVVLRNKIIDRWEELENAIRTPANFTEALYAAYQMSMEADKARAELQEANQTIQLLEPKRVFADAVAASKTTILIGELAKILKQNGVEIGQNRFFEWLRANGYLITRKGSDFNMPTQKAMNLGLFEIKETVIAHSDGHTSISKTAKVTGVGQTFFVNKFLNASSQDN
jgi:phage antirepressor YoqD-like protein